MNIEPTTPSSDTSPFLAEIHRLRSQVEAKQQLLNYVCHELRGPLHLARLCLGSALSTSDLTQQCRAELDLADKSLDRAAGMTADLLEATRIDRGILTIAPRPLDVGAVVDDVVAATRRVAAHTDRRLEVTIAADLPDAVADPERVRQIVGNLIDNALKFSPRDSTVRIAVTRPKHSPSYVEIAVMDEGDGVDLATADRLFERFHQAPSPYSHKGIGLGLYICRELVRRHGGEIWVQNRPTGGARFAFTLPVVAEPAMAPAIAC